MKKINSNIDGMLTALKTSERGGNNKTVLFIAAHPDDIEFFASYLCMESVNRSLDVHQLLSCCDEYGTSRNEFKGKRIRKIRRAEMIKAAGIYSEFLKTKNKVKLHWMDYIDGHVPFNPDSVKRMKDFILKIKPSIIVGPDPIYCFDKHRDHIATAKNFLGALKEISINYPNTLPKNILLYQTLYPNVFLNLKRKYRKGCFKAWHTHRSQNDIVTEIFWNLKQLLYAPCIVGARSGLRSEGYRRINFNRNGDLLYFSEQCGNKNSSKSKSKSESESKSESKSAAKGFCLKTAQLLFRFVFSRYSFGDMDEDLFTPSPSDLGLDLYPRHPII